MKELIEKLEIIKSSSNSDYVKNALIEAIQALSLSENKPITKEGIEYRIKEEFKKHKELDWAKIAASKIYALLPQSEWISVEDRLPKKGQLVLVYGLHRTEIYDNAQNKSIGKVEFKTIDYSICIDTCYYEQYYSDITHWMPLPQPPQTK